MYQGNASAQMEKEVDQTTQLTKIFGVLAELNSRLSGNVNHLEKIGHKLKDTNHPVESKEARAESKPDGLIQEIQQQLEYYKIHINRFEGVVQKLSELL